MSREDSNGEMFEIIDKKIEELSTAGTYFIPFQLGFVLVLQTITR